MLLTIFTISNISGINFFQKTYRDTAKPVNNVAYRIAFNMASRKVIEIYIWIRLKTSRFKKKGQ